MLKLAVFSTCLGFVLSGQTRPNVVEQQLAVANLPAHKVAPNDLIAVSVYDSPELTRTVRVGPDGFIHLPLLKLPVEAAGLLPFELESSIGKALKSEQIILKPVVSVTIMEYNSRYVSVNGAVRKPVTFQAIGETRLLDALARAEGLTEDAGLVLLLTRVGVRDGENPYVTINLNELMSGGNPGLNYLLEGGEQIRVPEALRIYVMGNVHKPGPIPLRDPSPPTVMRILSIAQGLQPYASNRAWIYRKDPGQDLVKEIPVPLKSILARKSPDMPLFPGDLLYIPDNTNMRITLETARTILTVGSGAVSAFVYAGVR